MADKKMQGAKTGDAVKPAKPVTGHILPGGDAFVSEGSELASAKIETRGANPLKSIGGSEKHAFNTVLLRQVVDTLFMRRGAEADPSSDGASARIAAAAAALAAFDPADEIEGMLAAQAVALHYGAMECLRRSVLAEQPADIAGKMRKDGANLARAMTDMLEALDRRRGKGPQVVRVERVVVHEGGQAVVGVVQPSSKPAAVGAPPPVPDPGLPAAAVPCEAGGGRG